ncbi:unnamed protein product [Hydatigera taeniaeformis]|uniref:Uncharacterized protein n=1 Tax=Hydatigena taeniaeformis TaxID=6205 RepID=A0A0R3XBJ8_HYDTA|nr:unnamed protein product [Hydatigera taeniaeformis]
MQRQRRKHRIRIESADVAGGGGGVRLSRGLVKWNTQEVGDSGDKDGEGARVAVGVEEEEEEEEGTSERTDTSPCTQRRMRVWESYTNQRSIPLTNSAHLKLSSSTALLPLLLLIYADLIHSPKYEAK